MRALVALAGLALLCAACARTPPALQPRPDAPGHPMLEEPVPEAEFNAWLQQRRAGIAEARTQVEADHKQAQGACWQRFAVNDCLLASRRERRQRLDALRQQGLALNARQRLRRTGARLQVLDEKSPSAGGRAGPAAAHD